MVVKAAVEEYKKGSTGKGSGEDVEGAELEEMKRRKTMRLAKRKTGAEERREGTAEENRMGRRGRRNSRKTAPIATTHTNTSCTRQAVVRFIAANATFAFRAHATITHT